MGESRDVDFSAEGVDDDIVDWARDLRARESARVEVERGEMDGILIEEDERVVRLDLPLSYISLERRSGVNGISRSFRHS